MTKQVQNAYRDEWEYFKAKIRRPTAICAAVFLAVALLYYAVSMQDIAVAKEAYNQISQLFEEKGFFEQTSSLGLFWMIFTNNAMAGFFVLVTGVMPFVFAPIWAVVSNAALAGVVIAVSQDSGAGLGEIMGSLLPHGIFELPAFFFTAGLGLSICHIATKKIFGRGAGLSFWKEFWRAWQSFVFVALPLFLLAAFVEAFITIAFVK